MIKTAGWERIGSERVQRPKAFVGVILEPSCLYLSAPRFNLTASVGAKTVTAVDEFWTAARSGPLTAPMAATSCVRPALVATERMVEAGAGAVAGGGVVPKSGTRTLLMTWTTEAPALTSGINT